MTPESLFKLANTLALVGWLMLVFQGWKRWVAGFVTSCLIPALLALLYVGLFVSQIGHAQGNFNSLAGVAALFSNPWLLLAGWIHYLAFDLFIGSWQVRDARKLGMAHWLLLPCLLLTFLLGPAGLLLYFTLRFILRRQVILEA